MSIGSFAVAHPVATISAAKVGTDTVKGTAKVVGFVFRHPVISAGLGLGAWHIVAYFTDVNFRRWYWARRARQAADARGKPMLNVGAGSSKTALFGGTEYGDVNCDYGLENVCDAHNKEPCHCDATKLPFEDKQFGAVLLSHVLEHIPDYETARAELERVADEVFIITPQWWAPHTWFYWDHVWYFRGGHGEGKPIPLWKRKETAPYRGKVKAKAKKAKVKGQSRRSRPYRAYIPGYLPDRVLNGDRDIVPPKQRDSRRGMGSQ